MLKVQVSFPEMKAHAQAIRAMAREAKNVLAKVRKKDHKVVADDMRRVFYAADALSAEPSPTK